MNSFLHQCLGYFYWNGSQPSSLPLLSSSLKTAAYSPLKTTLVFLSLSNSIKLVPNRSSVLSAIFAAQGLSALYPGHPAAPWQDGRRLLVAFDAGNLFTWCHSAVGSGTAVVSTTRAVKLRLKVDSGIGILRNTVGLPTVLFLSSILWQCDWEGIASPRRKLSGLSASHLQKT